MNVVICIPTRRPPPVATLVVYNPAPYEVVIVADPAVVGAHRSFYAKWSRVRVAEGKVGMAPQVAECYRWAAALGYEWYFRLDDDLRPRTFITKGGEYPTLAEVILRATRAQQELGVSLVGFHNGSNRHWMGTGVGRSYGLVHGGGHLCRSDDAPSRWVNTELRCFEDVWRSLAHRETDGAVGRVKDVGFDKRSSGDAGSTLAKRVEDLQPEITAILNRFPGMVECRGVRPISQSNPKLIVNWRFVRPKGWKSHA